jgi:cytochrome c peroxidase
MKAIYTTLVCSILILGCSEEPNKEKITTESQLGERLFFDPILSRDSSISCASCHKPEFAFADNSATSKGVFGRTGTRNTPSAMNQSDRNVLEEQALGPIENPVEMDLPLSIAIKRLLKNKEYLEAFQYVYGEVPSKELLGQAISSFEQTLETGKSVFDKYMSESDTTLMSASAKRGLTIFNTKGKCFDCHFGVDFTGNDRFKNIGLYNGNDLNDEGRFAISGNPKDLGSFKVPGLRNIAQTAPYMHNGQLKTLREVIDYYDTPDKFVANSINRDTLLKAPLGLTETEKKDLENFLLSLSDERFLVKK